MTSALAHEPPFTIGPLRFLPVTREVIVADGTRTVVEPRVMQVLIALARADGAIVTRDALIASCWDGRIVGEDAINRVISRLRHAGNKTGRVFRVETVTRIGYRLIVNAAVAPSVTGTTSTIPASPQSAEPVSRASWRSQLIAAVSVLAAVLVGFSVWRWSRTEPPPSRLVPQLNVSSFTALSPGVSPVVIAGAREEIVAAFGVTSLVDVTNAAPRAEAGPQAWALTGAIGRNGADLRFVIHLVHRTTGTTVWSTAIDLPAADRSRTLKRVAAKVAEVVASALPAAAAYRGGSLPDAALALMIQFNQDTTLPIGPYHHAEEEVRRVVAMVPDFAAGWSTLALALGYTATVSDDPRAVASARAEGPSVIAQALTYRPHDAEALLAAAKLVAPANFAAREAAFRVATAAPTSMFGAEHSGYAVFLVNVGRAHDAVGEAKFTYDFDPLAALYAVRYAHALAAAGHGTIADETLARSEYLWPDFAPTLALRTRLALWSGNPDPGILAVRADPTLSPTVRQALLATFMALAPAGSAGRQAAASALVALSRETKTNDARIVSALGALGADSDAVAAASRLIAAHNALAAEVLFDPTLARARRTPAFAALAEQVGLTGYWRLGHLPDFCAEPKAPALCAALRSDTL